MNAKVKHLYTIVEIFIGDYIESNSYFMLKSELIDLLT
jgi:hypothetical protein